MDDIRIEYNGCGYGVVHIPELIEKMIQDYCKRYPGNEFEIIRKKKIIVEEEK